MPSPLMESLARASRGEPEAMEIVMRDLYPQVQAQVHAMLQRDIRPGNHWVLRHFSTGDIVQELFLGALKDLPRFADQSEDALKAWISAQIRNRIFDRLRFHRRFRRDARRDHRPQNGASKAPEPEARDRSPSICASLEERAELFEEALRSLSDRERELWGHRFEEEKNFAEVAEEMGYSGPESARAAFRTLRAKLAIRLRRLGLTEGGEEAGS